MHNEVPDKLDYSKLDFDDLIFQRALDHGAIFIWAKFPIEKFRNRSKVALRNAQRCLNKFVRLLKHLKLSLSEK